jgi:hypothetical protein
VNKQVIRLQSAIALWRSDEKLSIKDAINLADEFINEIEGKGILFPNKEYCDVCGFLFSQEPNADEGTCAICTRNDLIDHICGLTKNQDFQSIGDAIESGNPEIQEGKTLSVESGAETQDSGISKIRQLFEFRSSETI